MIWGGEMVFGILRLHHPCNNIEDVIARMEVMPQSMICQEISKSQGRGVLKKIWSTASLVRIAACPSPYGFFA